MASKENIAVHAGARRSEMHVKGNPWKDMTTAEATRKQEEDPRFPGYHTVTVPRTNQRDSRASSPVGLYKGLGYKELSSDAEITGHEDDVILGIPVDVWIEREKQRQAEDNGRVTELISELDDPNHPQLKLMRERSGPRPGAPVTLSGSSAGPDDLD